MEFADEIKQALRDLNFSNIEDAQAILDAIAHKQNYAPCEDFHGLSPADMQVLLYNPFDSPELVEFPTLLSAQPPAPAMKLFEILANAIGEKGIKPTTTGNLPVKLVKEAAIAFLSEKEYKEHIRFGEIRKEMDFGDLHYVRVVAQIGGLVRKYKGRFILGRDCRKIAAKNGLAGVYPIFLRTYIERFHWGYLSYRHDMDSIQHSCLFTLYLLDQYGGEWRPNTFYEDAFITAFPRVVERLEPTSYQTVDAMLRSCYSFRSFKRFAEFLGLVEIEKDSDDRYSSSFRLRKTPLLNDAIQFHLPAVQNRA